MNEIATVESLLNSLNAYTKRFEIPQSRENLLAIASSILTFQQKQGNLAIAPQEIETLIHNTVDQFNGELLPDIPDIIDANTETLVTGVHQWVQTLESQVLNTLNAYVQNFLPDQALNLSDTLPDTILSIIPLVENAQLRKVEAESLIQRVTSKFNVQNALSQVIGNDAISIAQQLAKLMQFGSLEEQIKNTLLNNQSLIDQPLETITESLVNKELSKILANDALQFDIDLDSQQMMVKQLTLKLNVMQSSSPSTKSAAAIAQQMDAEVAALNSARQVNLKIDDIFKPR
ncbi:hypothetical protein [Pseudanabaena sp. Chao 1811]|uniref:hypothetical protein n=1 Tax=Pseudanabaena sp. Chao 1811 TaxID=2963092 RepID=UPI0022F3841A|nr:hypothetical protein [Pseudanabaena sp. Chao 1811]